MFGRRRDKTAPSEGLCPTCGRALDAHNRQVRFRLPDPVLNSAEQHNAPGVWLSEPDPNRAVMMQVPDLGAFVRVLLPVSLEGGDTITFGTWLGVHPQDLKRAFEAWWAPTYPELELAGVIANDVKPWGLLARPAVARVTDPDATPYVVESEDALTRDVLTRAWPHEQVIDALPEALR